MLKWCQISSTREVLIDSNKWYEMDMQQRRMVDETQHMQENIN